MVPHATILHVPNVHTFTEVHFRHRSSCRFRLLERNVLAWNVLACGRLSAWPPPGRCPAAPRPPPGRCLQTPSRPFASLSCAYLHSCFLSPACRSMGSSVNQLWSLVCVPDSCVFRPLGSGFRNYVLVRIRIWIRMLPSTSKTTKINHDFYYCFVTSQRHVIFEDWYLYTYRRK